MYHIPNDKRAEKSVKAISNGLITCLKKKELDEITVTDVYKTAGVSRATFYRLFDNTLDILNFESERIFNEIAVELSGKRGISIDQANIMVMKCGMAHSEVIGAIVTARRTDILLSAILKQKEIFFSVFAPSGQAVFNENVIHAMFLIMCQFLEVWIKNGKRETAEELYKELKQTVMLLAESIK